MHCHLSDDYGVDVVEGWVGTVEGGAEVVEANDGGDDDAGEGGLC